MLVCVSGGVVVRRAKAALLCCAVLAMSVAGLSGCTVESVDAVGGSEPAASAEAGAAQARVMVTTDFGSHVLLDELVSLDGDTTSMDALKSVAEVGTAYGGGFVQSINGLGEAREGRTDWFYAVNGILANRGAADHVLRDGDVEHWDYRMWGFRRNVSATLGCYPAFLLNGYGGTVRPTAVVYEAGYESDASRIVAELESLGVAGVGSVDMLSLSDEWKQERNLIIIAGPEADLVREVYSRWDRLGLFTLLDEGGAHVYTRGGDEAATYAEGTGVIDAVQNPWNPSGTGACESVALLLSGTDEDGVCAAVEALLDSDGAMMTWCGAVVRDGTAVPSPAAAA